MEFVRLGIIGVGNMGSGHLKRIHAGECPGLKVTAVADIDPDRLEFAKGVDDTIALYDDAITMLDSGKIDAVLVAVPHYFHPEYAIAAMQRGIHVMCEKPAGVYTLQVREMLAEADKHPELVFGMMFNQRTNCVYRKMRELVQSGDYGSIRRTNWIITNWYRPQFYYDSGAWRATWSGEGGGVLLNQCPHQLDLWQWICGMPVKVDAKLHYGKWHDIEVEDDVTAYVEYANGATGTFITSTGDAPGTNRFEITMDGGKLICEDNKLMLYKLDVPEPEFNKTCKESFGHPNAEVIEVETDGKNPQHNGVLIAFADAILNGGKLVADGREGINGLTISNAMHLSSWLGHPVDVPFDEQLYKDELMKRVATSRRKTPVKSVIADTSSSYNAGK
ncbi:MAG: Gfo/Idh/MocA family protein [Eubacteriales bacterium]